MADTRISSIDYTAMNEIDQTSETQTDFRRVVEQESQDQPGTMYYPDWSKYYGVYKNIPEVQSVIDKKAVWTIGRGYKADRKTSAVLDKLRGYGKDSFNDIMFNLIRQYTIVGDAFAEIVRDKAGRLTNLKPINPGSMVVHSDQSGIVKGYTQCVYPYPYDNIQRKRRVTMIKFSPKEIFHLAWNRLGDECHGHGTIEKLDWVIEARNEAQKDMRIIYHRYVKPLVLTMADTDDPTEIANLKTKIDKAVENMENLIVPKGTVEMEKMSIPQYSTLDPLPWIQYLQKYFIVAEGVPEVILGHGEDTTEATSKILYLAFQQTIEFNQLFLEQQIKRQLNINVQFNFPESIGPELDRDFSKRRKMNNFQMKEGFNVRGRK